MSLPRPGPGLLLLALHAMAADPVGPVSIPAGLYTTTAYVGLFDRVMMKASADMRCSFVFKLITGGTLLTTPSYKMKHSTDGCFVYDRSDTLANAFMDAYFRELSKRVIVELKYSDFKVCVSEGTHPFLVLKGETYRMQYIADAFVAGVQPGRETVAHPKASEGAAATPQSAVYMLPSSDEALGSPQRSTSNKRPLADTSTSGIIKRRATHAEIMEMQARRRIVKRPVTSQATTVHAAALELPPLGRYKNAEPVPPFENVTLSRRRNSECSLLFFLPGKQYPFNVEPGRLVLGRVFNREQPCYVFTTSDRRVVAQISYLSDNLDRTVTVDSLCVSYTVTEDNVVNKQDKNQFSCELMYKMPLDVVLLGV
ncbi:hypothetical protein FOZ60_001843 [Perkinsus olseni]|uniref:Uncharacterized protein n=1 Tax=Perkinsus olseni TaxID=32597 RepID=A0A7J6PJ61_PEROL|nr:hypothetical protein FOZ60_001843 [Perkinsus olseni]